MIRALLLSAVLALGFSSNSFSQEKKAERKTEKKAAKKAEKKKASAPSQDWNRFNTGAKRDLEKIEKKDAKGKK